jgi:hypothetical protein
MRHIDKVRKDFVAEEETLDSSFLSFPSETTELLQPIALRALD